MEFSREHIAARLADHAPRDPALAPRVRAAVAAILRFEGGPRALLMQRASRAGDQWSGQVSLPGGRESPEDPDLRATAVRETREEVGLDLDREGALLGRLDGVRAVARGRPLSMVIVPFVFELRGASELALGDEAESAFWLPLDDARSGRLDGTYRYGVGPASWHLPCWRYGGYTIWGLTYQMLTGFFELLGDR